ncbi:hypothetical protein ZIOFF_002755 [Zingiber officinale]|uniref:ARM repeat superfamily protein n=1 Tax=Zingiber officinale TaxID=94328 RepID=A0A8J5M9K9_ZINOF|nr:hypothetical protein ZIOFF_002755 [Zingiber officinale]
MLSCSQEQKKSSLHALVNLSTLDESAAILVDFGILPALTNILFSKQQDFFTETNELAASTIANIVSKSGHWEFSFADKEGHHMQSEFIMHKLLDLLSNSSCRCQAAILHILCGIVSSPRASDISASCIKSSDGIKSLVHYVEHPEIKHRVYSCRLLSLLSEKLGHAFSEEFRAYVKIVSLRIKLLDADSSPEETCEIACLLANLSFSDDEVKTVLGYKTRPFACSPNFSRFFHLRAPPATRSVADPGPSPTPTSSVGDEVTAPCGLLVPRLTQKPTGILRRRRHKLFRGTTLPATGDAPSSSAVRADFPFAGVNKFGLQQTSVGSFNMTETQFPPLLASQLSQTTSCGFLSLDSSKYFSFPSFELIYAKLHLHHLVLFDDQLDETEKEQVIGTYFGYLLGMAEHLHWSSRHLA